MDNRNSINAKEDDGPGEWKSGKISKLTALLAILVAILIFRGRMLTVLEFADYAILSILLVSCTASVRRVYRAKVAVPSPV
jgi:hypothetical protein